MRYLIQWLLVLLTVFPVVSRAALTDLDRQEISFKNFLGKYNGGFESGKANWTASGGTFAAVTSGTNLLDGKGSATWDASASGQTLTSQAVTLEKGYYGRNCMVDIVAQVPSGTGTHSVQAFDGTNILATVALVSSTLPRPQPVNFPCPQSGTVAFRFYSNADEPLIAFDLGYIGLARNAGSTSLDIGWTTYTPTLGGSATASLNTSRWMRVGDSIILSVYLAISNTPAGTMTVGLPSGVTLDTANIPGANDNTSAQGTGGWYDATGPTITTIRAYAGSASMTLTSSNVQLGANLASGDYVQFTTYPMKVVGWAAQNVVMPDAQGWFAAGLIAGAAPALSTSSQASAVEITDAGLSMTLAAGSAAAGIACANGTTNTAGALTCASANESVGFTVSVPTSGAYRVCFSASNQLSDAGSATNVSAAQTFQVNRTSAASSTVITSGVATAFTQLITNSGGGAEVITSSYPFGVCPIHQLSAGSNTFRLMYASSISGTLSANTLQTGGGVGNQGAYFSIMPVNSQANAILANSVSTGTTNGERIEHATLVNGSGTACTVTRQSTGFLSATGTRSGNGQCAWTITSGIFSAAPSCTCTSILIGGNFGLCSLISAPTTTAVGTITSSGTAINTSADSTEVHLTCMGPR